MGGLPILAAALTSCEIQPSLCAEAAPEPDASRAANISTRLHDPEVENLRVVFELLDTGCTGKIHFEHLVLHSGMKDEVLKGFMRRASKEGIDRYHFPKTVCREREGGFYER